MKPLKPNTWISKFQPHIWRLLLLSLATFAVYGKVIGHEFLMTWDDRLYVVHNEAVQGFSWQHIKALFSNYYVGNYAPVQMLSYMLDYELWGMKAGGFLFTNLLIHILNGFLLYRLLLRCHADTLLATVGTAVFLLHPVQVESVAWISERKNLLAMFFFLLSLEGYRRYRNSDHGKGVAAYTTSFGLFVLALLSKSVAVIFPLVLLMYDLCYPVKNCRFRFTDKIPYIFAAVFIAAVTIQSQQPVDDGWGGGVGGGVTGYHGGTAYATFLTMLTVFCRYIWMILWPANLSAGYEPSIHHSFDGIVIAAALLLSLLCIVAIRLYNFDRKAGFWILLFFIGLLPVSQIIPLITLMNDRYLYFPMIGVTALIGYVAALVHDKLRSNYSILFNTFLLLLLIILSTVTFKRVAIWHNDISIGRDTVAKSPNQYGAWEGLGEAYYFAKPPQQIEALKAYSHALELAPTSKLTLYNLGVLYLEMGEYDNSYAVLSKLLYYYSDHVMGWAYLGDIYLYRKNYPEAEKAYRQALTLNPETERAILGLRNLAAIQNTH